MLQTSFVRPLAGMIRGHFVDDSDLLLIHIDPLHHGPDDRASGRPVGLGKPGADLLGELLHPPDHQLQRSVLLLLLHALAKFRLEPFEFLLRCTHPRFELLFLQQAALIRIDQTADPSPQFLDCRAKLCARVPPLIHSPVQPSLVFLLDPPRIRQQRTHILPDGLLQQVRSKLSVRAYPLSGKPICIASRAAVVDVATSLALRRHQAYGLSIVCVPTPSADQQSLQHYGVKRRLSRPKS